MEIKYLKMNKRITTIKLTLFLCLLTFMSSCVETDLYELYDDNDFIQGYAPRQKKSKESNYSSYTCGVCCVAYIINNNNSNITVTLETVINKCNNLGISWGSQTPLTESQIESLLEACIPNSNWNHLTWNATINGIVQPNYYASEMTSLFEGDNYPMVINTGSNHWIVAESYRSEKKRWGKIVSCTEVSWYDPQQHYGDYSDIHDFPIIIYKEKTL